MPEIFTYFSPHECPTCKNRDKSLYVGHIYICKERASRLVELIEHASAVRDLWDIGELSSMKFVLFDDGPGNPTVVSTTELGVGNLALKLYSLLNSNQEPLVFKENLEDVEPLVSLVHATKSAENSTSNPVTMCSLHVGARGVWWTGEMWHTRCHSLISGSISKSILQQLIS